MNEKWLQKTSFTIQNMSGIQMFSLQHLCHSSFYMKLKCRACLTLAKLKQMYGLGCYKAIAGVGNMWYSKMQLDCNSYPPSILATLIRAHEDWNSPTAGKSDSIYCPSLLYFVQSVAVGMQEKKHLTRILFSFNKISSMFTWGSKVQSEVQKLEW